jgi:hypothetical protein
VRQRERERAGGGGTGELHALGVHGHGREPDALGGG